VTAAILVLMVAVALAAGVAAAWPQRAPRRPLPHRPAPGTPLPPGPRHRAADAHTASYSAADVLRRLNDQGRRP
jgi:hypothetical protein